MLVLKILLNLNTENYCEHFKTQHSFITKHMRLKLKLNDFYDLNKIKSTVTLALNINFFKKILSF